MNKLILIGGASGAGKTSLAGGIKELNPDQVSVVHVDDFQVLDPTIVREEDGYYNWETPVGRDFDLLYKSLKQLLAGQEVGSIPVATRSQHLELPPAEKIDKYMRIKPARYIVCEGHVALCDEAVCSLADLKVFCALPLSGQLKRRDVYSDEVYIERYLGKGYEQNIKPTIKRADLVLDGEQDFQSNLVALKERIDML